VPTTNSCVQQYAIRIDGFKTSRPEEAFFLFNKVEYYKCVFVPYFSNDFAQRKSKPCGLGEACAICTKLTKQ